MLNREEELLGILQEEAAEVIQAVSKMRRFGKSPKKLSELYLEIGDFCGIMKMLVEEGYLDATQIEKAAREKIDRVENWMTHKKTQSK